MDKEKDNLTTFSLSIYGDVTKYNEVLSKARCRIFYTGANRNGTFITDEFANKLVSTLPYVPVKGIYDTMKDDYTDHGRERYEGRIYGIVPENPNFAWEKHLDIDGVERTYACTDVYLFTGLYKQEAFDIIGKSQSMELYVDSIEGEWQYINGKKFFVFTRTAILIKYPITRNSQAAANNVPSPNASEAVIYRSNAYPIIPKIHRTPQVTSAQQPPVMTPNGIRSIQRIWTSSSSGLRPAALSRNTKQMRGMSSSLWMMMAVTAMMPPMARLPVSPMNTWAG